MTTIVQTNRELGKGKPVQLQARFSERKTATFPLARVSSLQEQKFKLVVACRRGALLTAMSCSLHSLPRWVAACLAGGIVGHGGRGVRLLCIQVWTDGRSQRRIQSTQFLANDSLLLAKAALRKVPWSSAALPYVELNIRPRTGPTVKIAERLVPDR